jgi:N-acetylmuramic acid 6-phosphate etherase
VSLIAGQDQRFDWVDGYAEDDTNYVVQQCHDLALSENDIVIGVSASGDTPYTATAMREARAAGALTVMLSANPDENFCSTAEITINVALPDEVIHGSTRLAAGTAHKMMLNSLSTGIMTQLGRVYKGHMVAMDVTNQKLQRRAIRIVTDITGTTEIQARHKLSLVNYDIRQAILILKGADVHQAVALLDEYYGHLGKAIKALPRQLKPRLLNALSVRN